MPGAAAGDGRRHPGGKAAARAEFFAQQRGVRPGAERVLPVRPDRSEAPTARPPAGEAADGGTIDQVDAGYAYLDAFRSGARTSELRLAPSPENAWRSIGPWAIPHGRTSAPQDLPGSRPSVAARVGSVAIDPYDGDHLLLATAAGGVWESRDRGTTWAPRTDFAPTLTTGAVAFDASTPGVAYAGTGEGAFYALIGTGVLRSSDGGTTWSLLATEPFVGHGFFDVAVDSLDPGHLLAATDDGLYGSADSGSTWASLHPLTTWDLSFAPAGAGRTIGAREVLAGCRDGVWRSTDSGHTWTGSVSLPGAVGPFIRIAVAHAPSNGSVAYALVAMQPVEGEAIIAGLWRRDVAGGGFSAVPLPADLDPIQAGYDWCLAVAPHNPDVVYMGAVELHKGFRGSDGTWSWATVSISTTGESIHPDIHEIVFDPVDPNTVYVTNDGGIARSTDGGATWRSLNVGLCISELTFVADHPDHDGYLLAGTQDNGTLRYEGEECWFQAEGGDGGDCAVDHASPYNCYHSFFFDSVLGPFGFQLSYSATGGASGTWARTSFYPRPGYQAHFYPPLEACGGTVAVAGESVFILSADLAERTEVALPEGAGIVRAMTFSAPGQIYVGTMQGAVARLELVGGAWTVTPLGRTGARRISDLLVDPSPAHPRRLWATSSDFRGAHVFLSDDAGASWRSVSEGLPDLPVSAIARDAASDEVAWVATDAGVYATSDTGTSWHPYGQLLPRAIVSDLAFHQPSRLLRAATKSRGMWEVDVGPPPRPRAAVHVRSSVVDTRRSTPAPSGVLNPFRFGTIAHWWQSPDVKIESPPCARPEDVDFMTFSDDHGMAWDGLISTTAPPGRTSEVYVQVHNRREVEATAVAVNVFFASAALRLPDLPVGFWTGFPSQALSSSSPWKPVGRPRVLDRIAPGRTGIATFAWDRPPGASPHTCLLALATTQNDPLQTTESVVSQLVRTEPGCGLLNLEVRPPPTSQAMKMGPVALQLWGGGDEAPYSVGSDGESREWLSALVLSPSLAQLAQDQGLETVELDDEARGSLEGYLEQAADVAFRLDPSRTWLPPPGAGTHWLEEVRIDPRSPELFVVLPRWSMPPGVRNILQWDRNGQLAGGYSIDVMEPG